MNPVSHTPLPWRIGDGGRTIFGPPNGNPSPLTITTLHGYHNWRANTALIVRSVNSHEQLLEACNAVRDNWEGNLSEAIRLVNSAIAAAEGRQS